MKRDPGALLHIASVSDFRSHSVVGIRAHSGNISVVARGTAAGLEWRVEQILVAPTLQCHAKPAPGGTWRSAEQSDERVCRCSHGRRRIPDSRHHPKRQIALRGFLCLIVPHGDPDRRIMLVKRRYPDKVALLAEVANDVFGPGTVLTLYRNTNMPGAALSTRASSAIAVPTGFGEGRLGSTRTVMFALAQQDTAIPRRGMNSRDMAS